MSKGHTKTIVLTALAVLAFAANSLLTRRALAGAEIQAVQFVAVRLISGAFMLALLVLLSGRGRTDMVPRRSDLGGILSLLTYAVAFTLAYVRLGAAVGALILFPTVQLTLVAIATLRGIPPSPREVLGLLIALIGIIWLLAPQATLPSLVATVLMVMAGVAWGIYTMLGRDATDPLARTARNFIGAAPMGLILLLASPEHSPGVVGLWLAVLSGAIASALGYVVWYAVLPQLTAAAAGAAQLLVPAITAITAILWLGEHPSVELIGGCALILSGVWMVTHRVRIATSA